MRIIGGRWRGRTIGAPRSDVVRPTADRAREAWMSIVSPELVGARVLDLFAGTGALGLEALSRGAAHCDFVDASALSLRTVSDNARHLGATAMCAVHREDALAFVERLAPHTYDVAFADPPYGAGLAPRLAELWLARPFASVIGLEHEVTEALPAGGELRRYGRAAITFYRAAAGDGE